MPRDKVAGLFILLRAMAAATVDSGNTRSVILNDPHTLSVKSFRLPMSQ